MIGWLIVDKDIKNKKVIMNFLIKNLINKAKEKGIVCIYTYSKHSSMLYMYKKIGFKKYGSGINTLGFSCNNINLAFMKE